MLDPHTPPRTYADIASMDQAELMAGYIGYERGDPEPGGNHSRAYWWGWWSAANPTEGPMYQAQRHVARLIAPRGRMMTGAEIQAAAAKEQSNAQDHD